jgi:pyroglutamyl-peptidase
MDCREIALMNGRVALLTGFEPYGGRGVNPAFEIMRRLDGAAIGDTKVVGRPLPVSYEALNENIETLLEELTPAAIVSVGLWPGEPMLRLERLAVNVADFEIPDNDGLVLSDATIQGNAQTAFMATLPLRAIEEALLSLGIPVRVSNTAGTFLCNATMFGFLQALAARGRAVPCGFVHVPYLPSQVADILRKTRQERRLEREQRADIASMSLETMVEAVRTVLETTLRAA